MGSFGPLKVLTAQPETRCAKRFLFWQAVVVCAGAETEGEPPRKSVLRFFLVACVSLLELIKDLKGVQNVVFYLWPLNSIIADLPLLHQVPIRIL